MLFDYMDFPTKEEREEIYQSFNKFNELRVDINYNDDRIESYIDIIENRSLLEHWLSQFNRKLGEVRISYIFLMHYFNKCQLYSRESTDERKVNEDYQGYKYFFNFFIDVFYHKALATWDFIYHVINMFYKLEVSVGVEFNKTVMQKLKSKSNLLYMHLNKAYRSNVMQFAKNFRNDLTHNFPPYNSTYEHEKLGGGVTGSFLIPSVEPTQSMDNVISFLDLLADTLSILKSEFEKDLKKVKLV